MIKLLRGESEQVDVKEKIGGVEVEISFRISVVSSSMQARLLDLAKFAFSDEGKQKYFSCQFKNCLDGDVITVSGKDICASELADRADLSHYDTMQIIGLVSGRIDKFIFVQDEEVKK